MPCAGLQEPVPDGHAESMAIASPARLVGTMMRLCLFLQTGVALGAGYTVAAGKAVLWGAAGGF